MMKGGVGMGERSKLMRNLRQESRRFRLIVVVIGFFLVTLTFVVVSKPEAILFNLNKIPVEQTPTSILIRQPIDTQEKPELSSGKLGKDPKVVDEEGDIASGTNVDIKEERTIQSQAEEEQDEPTEPEKSFDDNDNGRDEEQEHNKLTLPTVSNYTIHDSTQAEDGDAKQEDGRMDMEIKLDENPVQTMSSETDQIQMNPIQTDGSIESEQQDTKVMSVEKHLCDVSNFRANVCEMEGDIRIHPNSTSILYMEPADSQRDEVWKIKPYPRKGDEFCLSHVTELTVKSSREAPQCTKYRSVPAVIFSVTGYTGNLFHDFTDVVVPLFTTANEFSGEVQFLITNWQLWWTIKYHTVLQKLSNYPLIDFSKDDQVHCFKHAIVGLHAYKEFTIDTALSPHNYSMVDFNYFMRHAYSLPREAVTALGEQPGKKPRLLIISRKRSRMFLNLAEIVAMAEELGYEVVVDEANVSSDLSRFAAIVNSVDVMMGVHGAGLTNCVFLPQNGTLIQVVPWGGLDWISRLDFGDPSEAMGLRYKQYSIAVEESSLTNEYPRDHEIFKNPFAFHKKGFDFIRRTFMDNQNVKLDVKRFRSVLLDSLDHLSE